MNKELKIDIPEGYEIDKENSTFERIVFKKKYTYPKSWEEFCENKPTTYEEYYISLLRNYILWISYIITHQSKLSTIC